jgi:hypothetical protein
LSAKAPATYATTYAAQSAHLVSHGRSSLLIVIALGLSADNRFPPVVTIIFLLHHLLLAAMMNRVKKVKYENWLM